MHSGWIRRKPRWGLKKHSPTSSEYSAMLSLLQNEVKVTHETDEGAAMC